MVSEPKARVVRKGLLDMQVCVPKTWTDDQIVVFAESENPSGTDDGWVIRKEGSELLAGAPERVECESDKECCHITLDALLALDPLLEVISSKTERGNP